MQTIQSARFHQRSSYDRVLMPRDEFDERLREVRKRMMAERLSALLVFGNYVDYAPLCYLSGYIPTSHWGVVLVPLEGEAALFISTFSRDMQLERSLTNLARLHAVGELGADLGRWLSENVRASGIQEAKIGLCGSLTISTPVYTEVVRAAKSFQLVNFDTEIENQMRKKRPREIMAITNSCEILHAAMNEIRQGGETREGMIEAILRAQKLGANDVRLMYSTAPGTPMKAIDDKPVGPAPSMLVYLGIEKLGYWADGFYSDSRGEISTQTREVLEGVIHRASLGVTGKLLGEEVVRRLPPGMMRHPVTKDAVGWGLGLSKRGTPILSMGRRDTICNADICSLAVGLEGKGGQTVVSAILRFGDRGKEVLWKS